MNKELQKNIGFLAGWMQTVLFFPGTIAACAVIFAQQASELLGSTADNMKLVLPIVGGGFVVINQLLTSPIISLGGITITLIGFPVYKYMSKSNNS